MTSPNFIYIIAGILVLYVLIFLALMRIRFFNKTRQRFFSYFLKPVNEISKGGATEVIKTFFIWRAIGLIILIALFIIIAGGFFAWQYFGTLEQIQPRPAEQTTKDETASWQLKPIDGFSFQIYKEQELIRSVTKEEILSEYKKKYGNRKFSVGEDTESAEFLFVRDPIDFVYDSNRQRLIVPLTPVEVTGTIFGWDFFIFDTKKNKFYISPGENKPYALTPSHLVISPNFQYLAYSSGGAGGTCVLFESPNVISLETFEAVNIGEVGAKIRKAFIEKSGKEGDYYSYSLEELAWISDNKLRTLMKLFCSSPGGLPEGTEVDVEFQIAE